LDQFTVTPASNQAGSHPNVTIFQSVSLSSADDDPTRWRRSPCAGASPASRWSPC
jgi:hypothetical protein